MGWVSFLIRVLASLRDSGASGSDEESEGESGLAQSGHLFPGVVASKPFLEVFRGWLDHPRTGLLVRGEVGDGFYVFIAINGIIKLRTMLLFTRKQEREGQASCSLINIYQSNHLPNSYS